ncbi:hypothetical protein Tdes44962_MAKER09006 [Teratosphaeria destructans]|uniref:Uncharacterized protein n=1 Tax=Teratosphaeria destructans TaxID=418781 RepID=A0A9W7W3I3_9PEZI|nr:hypothetical protein Tdes44962_MAKER09006 [Teratosphaeria destructans]
MPSGKPRLYVALCPSGTTNNVARKYHWGFLVGPKAERKEEVPGTSYHVKNSTCAGLGVPVPNVRGTSNLLARVLIAKITDPKRLVEILRSQPLVQNGPDWRCRTWVASVLKALAKDGTAVGTSRLNWETVEATSRRYVASEIAEGRYEHSDDLFRPKPTWDMLEDKETVTWRLLLASLHQVTQGALRNSIMARVLGAGSSTMVHFLLLPTTFVAYAPSSILWDAVLEIDPVHLASQLW